MNNLSAVTLAVIGAFASLAAYADSPGGTHRFYEVRGVRLYTQTFGHGPPIVFLHGDLLFLDNNFAHQRDYFASYRTVVLVHRLVISGANLRGGLSSEELHDL
jgi:hypothetical protein